MLLKWQVDRDNLLELVQLESFSHTKTKEVHELDSIHPPWLTMSCKPFVNFTPTPNIYDPNYPKFYPDPNYPAVYQIPLVIWQSMASNTTWMIKPMPMSRVLGNSINRL